MALRKQHKTAKGLTFDMEAFKSQHESTVAVGNLGGTHNVNAKGDIIDGKGNVIEKREKIVRQYYRGETPKIREQSISKELERQSKLATPTLDNTTNVFVTPEEAMGHLQEEKARQEAKFVEPKPKRKPRTKKE